MIKLKNISTEELYCYLRNNAKKSENLEEYLEAMYIIINSYIANYQQLKDYIESDKSQPNNRLLEQALKSIETKVFEGNTTRIIPELYITKGYENAILDNNTISITEINKGRVLLYQNPTVLETVKTKQISKFSIRELKFMLAHLNANLRNEFQELNQNFNQKDINRLISTINFFEEQVIRQYIDIKEIYDITSPIDVFSFNKAEKEEIVESQLQEITEYLIDSGNDYIWGTLTNLQKQKILKSVLNNNKEDKFIRKNIIDIVSNYTTLSELQEGVTKKRTLDRFIIR